MTKKSPQPEMVWPAEALAPTGATRARQAPAAMTAPFWILDTSAIAGLRETVVPTKTWLGRQKDVFSDYLRDHARTGPKYHGTARAITSLLDLLQKRGIDLLPPEHRELADFIGSARGCTAFILNAGQGRPHLEILNPFLFLESELRDHYNAAQGTTDPRSGKPMIDALVAFRDCLRSLAHDSVALLLIA